MCMPTRSRFYRHSLPSDADLFRFRVLFPRDPNPKGRLILQLLSEIKTSLDYFDAVAWFRATNYRREFCICRRPTYFRADNIRTQLRAMQRFGQVSRESFQLSCVLYPGKIWIQGHRRQPYVGRSSRESLCRHNYFVRIQLQISGSKCMLIRNPFGQNSRESCP